MPNTAPGTNPFGEHIGTRFAGFADGESTVSIDVGPHLMNPHGVVHGGVLYTLADTGMGAALYTVLDADEACATVEIKINYFKSVRAGELVCKTQLVHRSRSIAVLQSDIMNQGNLVARALGTYAVTKSKRES